eukprot:5457238-Amphidinium_carterae.4
MLGAKSVGSIQDRRLRFDARARREKMSVSHQICMSTSSQHLMSSSGKCSWDRTQIRAPWVIWTMMRTLACHRSCDRCATLLLSSSGTPCPSWWPRRYRRGMETGLWAR